MYRLHQIRILFALLALLFSPLLMATAEQDFKQAMEFFRAGDYASAAAKFESARRQGVKTVSLHYNLGSSYYKLGNYKKARYHFNLVKQSPRMRDLAEYNLGLIAAKTGDLQAATQHFNATLNASKDTRLRAMARKQLAELAVSGKPWRAYVAANFGYDDNITASPSDVVQNVSDTFYDLFVSVDRIISGRRKQGWIADASYFRIDFSDDDLYDDSQLSAGIRKEQRWSDWDTKTHATFSNRDYAGEDFQSIFKLDVLGKTSLSRTERLYLRYIYEDISSDDALYDYLQGWRQRARIEYRDYQRSHITQLYYELELNDRDDIVEPTYSVSYSPTRHGIRGKYTHIIDSQWRVTGDLSYRISDYPASAVIDREDDRWRFAIDAEYRIDRTTRLKTKLQYINNESTEDIYDYDKTVLSVGVTKLF